MIETIKTQLNQTLDQLDAEIDLYTKQGHAMAAILMRNAQFYSACLVEQNDVQAEFTLKSLIGNMQELQLVHTQLEQRRAVKDVVDGIAKRYNEAFKTP